MATVTGLTPARIAQLISTAIDSLTPGSIGAAPATHRHDASQIDNLPSGGGGPAANIIFVNSLAEIPPGTPADTLVVLRIT